MDSIEQLQKDLDSACEGWVGDKLDRKTADRFTEAVYEHAKRTGTVHEFRSVFDSSTAKLKIDSLISRDE